MNRYLVECCANSVQSAINGEKGGANRIELCADLELGGLTPKKNDILKANAEINIPVHVLICPKEGNFVYSDDDLIKIMVTLPFLLEFGLGAGGLEFFLQLFSLFLGDAFLDGFRRAFDQFLGFLQAEPRDASDFLDDGDLVATEVR